MAATKSKSKLTGVSVTSVRLVKTRVSIAEIVDSCETVQARTPAFPNADFLLFLSLIVWSEVEGAEGYGRKTALAREMTQLAGHNITRDMVRCWLHPDVNKRRQPSFHYGLLLIAAGERVMRSFNKKNHGNHSRTTTKKRLR